MSSSIHYALQNITDTNTQAGHRYLYGVWSFFVSSFLLLFIRKESAERDAILASGYANKMGTPALFHKSFSRN